MKCYLFQTFDEMVFRRLRIEVESFQREYLLVKPKGLSKNLYRMKLQDKKRTFFDLLTADILHIYIKGEDFSKAYSMENVKEFSLFELGISSQQQYFLKTVEEGEQEYLKQIQGLTSLLIDHYGNMNEEKFKILTEAVSAGISDPEIFNELRDIIAG